METVTRGWRFVHIGVEDDSFTIDGIRVWDGSWVATDSRIVVEHPQYPNQRHSVWTYRMSASGGTVEFAAGEFSNGVWGFFVPDRPIPWVAVQEHGRRRSSGTASRRP